MLLLSATVFAQSNLRIEPAAPKQGDVIRVSAGPDAATARLNNRTITLWQSSSDTRFGLMPVGANDRPAVHTLEILNRAGAVIGSQRITIRDAHFARQNVKLPPKASRLKPSPGEMETVAAFRNVVSDRRFWEEPIDRPVDGCLTSPYGVRRLYNGKYTGQYHAGVDQASPAGTPIRAIAGGTVRLVRDYNIHGKVVGVDHGQGLLSIYLHMSQFDAAEGQVANKGDVLGYVGSTGRSTAPHLHWSLYVNGVAVNPLEWVKVAACTSP